TCPTNSKPALLGPDDGESSVARMIPQPVARPMWKTTPIPSSRRQTLYSLTLFSHPKQFFSLSLADSHRGLSFETRVLSGHGRPGLLVSGGQRAVHRGDRLDSGTAWPGLDGTADEMV